MAGRKILGFIFIIIACLLVLATLGQMPAFFGAIFGFFQIFTGSLDSYHTGQAIGHLIYWLMHFALMIVLWIYGIRWTGKLQKNKEDV